MKFNVLSKKSAVISVEPYPETLKQTNPPKQTRELFPTELIEEMEAFPFEKNSESLKIAAVNPQKASLQEFVKNRFPEENILWFKCTEQDVAFVLKHSARDF